MSKVYVEVEGQEYRVNDVLVKTKDYWPFETTSDALDWIESASNGKPREGEFTILSFESC